MKQTLTQSMAWLHTWGGLIVGWLLFVIFLTGSLAVFDQEIDNWMQPELPAHHLTDEQAAQRALDYLTQHKAGEKQWGHQSAQRAFTWLASLYGWASWRGFGYA